MLVTVPVEGFLELGKPDLNVAGAACTRFQVSSTWVVNAQEALTRLNEPDRRFDVVFSDVVMPGMSGVELGEEIRRRYPGLPVGLTSGYSHVLAEEGQHGFELLKKPYAAEDLSWLLRRVSSSRKA